MRAGLYSPSLTARLAHLCDTVIGLEAVRDDADIVRLIPEPARYQLLVIHQDCPLLQLETYQAHMLKKCSQNVEFYIYSARCVCDCYVPESGS